ncbi:MAG: S8 family serine peptidase [Planctomycetota bacterium]
MTSPVTTLPAAALLAVLAPLTASAQQFAPSTSIVEFVEQPGLMEFTGVLCARPLQLDQAEEFGLTVAELQQRVTRARQALEAYEFRNYVAATDEYFVFVPEGQTESSAATRLLSTGGFDYVEPDWLVYPIACPDDTQFNQQWHHQANRMQSCDAWDIETGDPSIVVAICDTGIFAGHSDLQLHRYEAYHVPSGRWENQGGPVNDIQGHGTLCVGTAAANGDNGNGVSGVGWNLGHRMMRVTDSSNGNASLSALTAGARTAVEAGDRVASVSYSGVTSGSVNTTGTYVRSLGSLLVWAAGNSSQTLSGNRDDDVIIVAATTSGDNLAGFSNRGSLVDLAAPGAGVRTTNRNGSYSNVSGTSFACPMVAGLCGLIWSRNPNLTPDEVEQILRDSCDDLGAPGVDNTFGYGRINSNTAMLLTNPPTVSFSFPNGQPDEIVPDGTTTIDIVVTPGDGAVEPTGALFWVDSGNGFVSKPLFFIGNDTFRVAFPQTPCPADVAYYFDFDVVGGGTVTSPAGGSAAPFETLSITRSTLEFDDLELVGGWTVGAPGDDASTGIWEFGDPIGTAAQPEDDHTPGGVNCFFTGNGTIGGSIGQNDVDDGSTTLLSPVMDLSLYPDPLISYHRWYVNDGNSTVNDRFVVDISDDGGATWTNVETLGPNNVPSGWNRFSFRVRDFAAPTTTVQLRFIASDLGGGSIVEAAVDDVEVFDQCAGSVCGYANYCQSSPNSTGVAATISAVGSTSIGANDLVLVASSCPPGSFGVFAYSPDRISQPLGNGTLCLGAQTIGAPIRLGPTTTDLLGGAVLAFDNQAPPVPAGQVMAGDTWNFQFLYRDVPAGGAFFNLTDAISVTFCP